MNHNNVAFLIWAVMFIAMQVLSDLPKIIEAFK